MEWSQASGPAKGCKSSEVDSGQLNTDPCIICDSPFLYGSCGHVVSGELNIISTCEIRDLMKMGGN